MKFKNFEKNELTKFFDFLGILFKTQIKLNYLKINLMTISSIYVRKMIM